MSDEAEIPRDDATGQFASDEPLYGRAKDEADAGLKPMFGGDDPITFDSAKDASDILAMTRETDDVIVPIAVKDTSTGEVAPANETMTAEQAAHLLTAYRANQNADFAKSLGTDFAAEVDKLRGVTPEDEAGEIEQPVKKETAPKAEDDVPSDSDLDPEIQKALKHPQVREAIEQEIGKAAQAHQEYSSALGLAKDFAVATFTEHFPELAGLPIEYLQQGLETLREVNPERFTAAVNTLQRVNNIQIEQQTQQQRQAEQRRQQLLSYKAVEDAKFHRAVPKLPTGFAEELNAYVNDLGVDHRDLDYLRQTQPFVHSAAFQHVLHDAVRYRLIQKAKTGAVSKPVPHVQRPGVARSTGESNNEAISKLSSRLAASGSLKDAQALRQAQYKNRRS